MLSHSPSYAAAGSGRGSPPFLEHGSATDRDVLSAPNRGRSIETRARRGGGGSRVEEAQGSEVGVPGG